MGLPSLYLIGALLTLVFIGSAHADYGIILSNSCITMLKNNVSTSCPSYEILNAIYPDTSIQEVSGGFIEENGYYFRDNPPYENHEKFYQKDFDKNRMWIDPPPEVQRNLKRIYIQPGYFTYKIKGQTTLTNSSYYVGENRYVSSTCTEMTISSEDWIRLLGDSIYLLYKNCDRNFSFINDTKLIEWEATKHDITTSYKYQLEQWIKESKEKAKQYLIPK